MATTSGTIEIYRGNTWGPYTPVLQLSDGTPFELPEGAVLLFTVKLIGDRRQDDTAAVITKDFTGGVWELTSTDTDIAEDSYRWDIKVVAPNIEINSAPGVIIIKQRVGVRDE